MLKTLKFIVVLLLTFCFLSTANAENFKTYTVADGLLDSAVNCVYQDKRGLIWLGSNKGITSFDGINFKTFRFSNADERVKTLAIFEDKNGLLWVVTEIGILIWTGKDFQEAFKYHGLTSFCLDADGTKWLGSDKGIVVLGEGLDEVVENRLSHIKGVTALYKDKENNIWIGTTKGVYSFDGHELSHYTTEDGLKGNVVNAVYEAQDSMFFATDGGISYYDGMFWNSFTEKDGLHDNYTTSVFKDFRGKLWFGTKSGVSIYDDSVESFYDSWKIMTTNEGLADDHVTCMYLDRCANLWIGTKNGVTKINISFDYLITVKGMLDRMLSPVFFDIQKRVWFATDKGVTSFDGDEFVSLTEDDGLSGKVDSIYQDPDSEIIFFGTSNGINEFEEDRISETHKPVPNKREWGYSGKGVLTNMLVFPDKDEGLVGREITKIAKDADDNYWVATKMALNKLSGNSWTTYTRDEGLLDNIVNDILLLDDGTLYFATGYGVSTFYDGEFLDPITTENGLVNNSVMCMFKDKDGNIYFGTRRGVSRYDGENFTSITVENGLAGDIVNTIFQDSRGFIWFATDEGITKYDGTSMSIYTTVDGLLVNDIKTIAEDDRGVLWFGTDFGIMRYLPDNVPPTSIVTNAPEKPVVMPKYTFELTGADLNSSKFDLFYSYKVDEGEWSEFSKKNVFIVEELDNGTHILSVRAKDKALNIQEYPLQVSFDVNTKQFDIEIVDIKFNKVFSVLYQYYNSLADISNVPFGEITLKSKFDKDIKIKINSFIKDYMDFPSDTRAKLKAQSTLAIPIRLEFNENILTAPSGFKKVNMTLQYFLHGENKEYELNGNIMVYDKNTITWDDPKKIGAFITVQEKVINNFVRKVIQMYKDESKESIIYDNLIRAMELFDAFGAHGIRYIADPTSPYKGLKAKKDAFDTLRFPKETLALKSGDCDDCVVLYCTALENIGINTAVIDTYDHLFMMFDVGLKKKDLGQITTNEDMVYIDDEDNVWLPIETTLFGKSFSEAWEVGAKKWNAVKDKSTTYFMEDAWELYKPAEVESSDDEIAAITAPSKDKIDLIYKKDVDAQESALLSTLVAKYEAILKDDPENVQAYNSLGIVLAKNGYLDRAEENFKKVIELKPDYAGGHTNLGNILFEKGYYNKSVEEYKKSLMLKPDNARVFIELAIAYSMLDDFTNAKKAYLDAIKIDPDIEKKMTGEGE
jgi:ligand-binding sensor domain-containing protein/tetratricopeptide (TPR) repeat protein